LFDGTGPDVSEENLAPMSKAVTDSKATAGLATDGDADRFGIVDGDGKWIQPNLVLGSFTTIWWRRGTGRCLRRGVWQRRR
jgi:phosphoglucomutase